jgi:type II secretory pathway pseudopilin PulG
LDPFPEAKEYAVRRSGAFSLVELLVVVSIIALLVGICVPTLSRARWTTRKAVCAANMHTAARGLSLYAADNRGKYPNGGFNKTTGFDVIGDNISTYLAPDSTSANSNTRNLYLAVRSSSIQTAALICPNTKDIPADNNQNLYDFNFASGANYRNKLSFSFHLQFPYRATTAGHPLSMTTDPTVAVLADRNPNLVYSGAAQGTGVKADSIGPASRTNSKNHDGEGQNAAYADGHIEWLETPDKKGDNIYTAWGMGDPANPDKGGGTLAANSMPQDDTDSFLVP